jgi:hypothetical protein
MWVKRYEKIFEKFERWKKKWQDGEKWPPD